MTASLNPEPLAPFVDLFTIGEAEALIPDLLDAYRRCRSQRLTKGTCLQALGQIAGVYVPSLYDLRYDKLGRIRAFKPHGAAPPQVRRRIAQDLSKTIAASRVLTSSAAFESLFLIEIGRGCPRACRFCAAGHVFRPTRYRNLEEIRPAIEEGVKTGKRIGLVSSSVCDHPQIDEICHAIFAGGGKISVASLRLDALGDNLLRALAQSGHRTLSLAPEAGSQRLRDVIRKGITEGQIMDAVARIAWAGILSTRLYFMVGLPTEKWQDVEAIVDLVRKVLHQARKATNGQGLDRLTLSINPFVPKPSTPFQWHPFLEVEELKARIQFIRRALRKDRPVHIIYEPPKWARIQALLARGDRRVGSVLLLVARGKKWDEALKEVNLNPAFYLHRQREFGERFPWDFIDQGFSKASLWESYQRALSI